MHYENRLFWQRCIERYANYFNEPSKIIDFGSCNINGVIHDWVTNPFYIGVDWRPGPNVDLISLAHEVPFRAGFFDTVVSSSMLEHDPYWDKSLAKMVEVLKEDGIFIVTWGAALNQPHNMDTAPDGKHHALKGGLVLLQMERLGMYIHEFQYERIFCLESGDEEFIKLKNAREDTTYGKSSLALVAFKDESHAVGEQYIEPLIDEDEG